MGAKLLVFRGPDPFDPDAMCDGCGRRERAMRHTTLLLALGLAGAVVGCTSAGPSPSDRVPLTGAWGATHAALTLTDIGGSIEYDCAHGALGAPVRPDAAGRFTVDGVHVREHGGPVRIGEVPDSVPARYLGRVSGDRMTLRVLVGADTLGPFELRRGAEPRLVRCL
jgi:hypothetical protein